VPVDCIDTGFAGGFLLFLDPCAAGFSGSNPFLLPLYSQADYVLRGG